MLPGELMEMVCECIQLNCSQTHQIGIRSCLPEGASTFLKLHTWEVCLVHCNLPAIWGDPKPFSQACSQPSVTKFALKHIAPLEKQGRSSSNLLGGSNETFGWGTRFPGGSVGKESTGHAGNPVSISDGEDPLEKEMATHSRTLAWKNLMDRGGWQAIVHGVAKSQIWLSN